MHPNLSELKYRGRKNGKGSWEFWTHQKFLNKDQSGIDVIIRRINARGSKQIDCTKCANCCKEMGPRITKHDIRAISKHLGLAREKVISRYLKERENKEGEYLAARIPCPFLKKNRCSIYEVRPKGCKSYPSVGKVEFISRLAGVIGSYAVCPIVSKVYHQIKTELKFNA